MYLKIHITLIILLLCINGTWAQDNKEDIQNKAASFFHKRAFSKASPLYLQLLAIEPKNPNYNYKYGTCLLFGAENKKKAFQFLKYAVRKDNKVDPAAFYYLGQAYQLNFRFNKAIENYKIFQQKADNKTLEYLDVAHQIEMCNNGKSLMQQLSDLVVIKKKKIDKNSFFRIYDLNNIGGNLIVTKEFQTKRDEKNNHIPLIYFSSNPHRIYYASYGENNNNLDIYVRTRLPNGKWSKAQPIFGKVNTPFDENYPFMDQSGNYLYFSSKGHNSMGGYDVFRSKYNTNKNTFEKPENMGIAISSPSDDILYIVDSLHRYANFASNRATSANDVEVYNVRVERFPIQMVILKGNFLSYINPEKKKLSIVIFNSSGEKMGQFKTDDNGEYLINLPHGGQYQFVMRAAENGNIQKVDVQIPYLRKFRPLKQRIIEKSEDSSIKLVVQNLFDEHFKNENEILAKAIQIKAQLNVNKDQFNLDSLDKISTERATFEAIGLGNLTTREIKNLISSHKKDIKIRTQNTKKLIAELKNNVANQKNNVANHIQKITSLQASISDDTKNIGNKEKMLHAKIALIETEKKLKNLDATNQLLIQLQKEDLINQQKLNAAKQLFSDIDTLTLENTEAYANMLKKHNSVVKHQLLKPVTTNIRFEWKGKLKRKVDTLHQLEEQQQQLQQKIDRIQQEIIQQKSELPRLSKRKKEDLQVAIQKKKIQLDDLKNLVTSNKKQINVYRKFAQQNTILTAIASTENSSGTSSLKTSVSFGKLQTSFSKQHAINQSLQDKYQIDTSKNPKQLLQIIENEYKETNLVQNNTAAENAVHEIATDNSANQTDNSPKEINDTTVNNNIEHHSGDNNIVDRTPEQNTENNTAAENAVHEIATDNSANQTDNSPKEINDTTVNNNIEHHSGDNNIVDRTPVNKKEKDITENSKLKNIRIKQAIHSQLTQKENEKLGSYQSRLNKLLEDKKSEAPSRKRQRKIVKMQTRIVQLQNDALHKLVAKKNLQIPLSIPINKGITNGYSVIHHGYINIGRIKVMIEQEKSPQKKKQLLIQLYQAQINTIDEIKKIQRKKAISDNIQKAITIHDYKNIEVKNSYRYPKKVKKEQQEIALQILTIEDEIKTIDKIILLANKKEIARLQSSKEQLIILKQNFIQQQKENEQYLNKIKKQQRKDSNKGVSKEAINNKIPYPREVAIAKSEFYGNLLKDNNKLNQLQYELQIKKEQIVKAKSELNALIKNSNDIELLTSEEKNIIASNIEIINKNNATIVVLRGTIHQQQEKISNQIDKHKTERSYIENMLVRNVLPIKEVGKIQNIPLGLTISTNKTQTYSEKQPIPIGKETTKGLVFRVQIGAFSRPVPNNTFNEFFPISGFKVRPGLIRYVVGYFNNRTNANTAKDKIRTLGYSDAFVVAYCDGQRIPVYRAMELMASGSCVPQIKTPQAPITITSTTIADRLHKEALYKKYDYNQNPGAAKAAIGELKMGLYYTVQIGVYNTPVSAAQLHHVTPLVTLRTQNGQIRYSSGIFNSIKSAKPHQKEVIQKGITDAYITAYYKGKRITISQAKQLLKEKGETILEQNNPTNMQEIATQEIAKEKPVKTKNPPFLLGKNTQYQMISKTHYVRYPLQVLNRYNATNSHFYYDSISQTIKSFLFDEKKPTSLPFNDEFKLIQLYENVFPIDHPNGTTVNTTFSGNYKSAQKLTIQLSDSIISGEIVRYIYALPYNKQWTENNKNITLNITLLNTPSALVKLREIGAQFVHFGAIQTSIQSIHLTDSNKLKSN